MLVPVTAKDTFHLAILSRSKHWGFTLVLRDEINWGSLMWFSSRWSIKVAPSVSCGDEPFSLKWTRLASELVLLRDLDLLLDRWISLFRSICCCSLFKALNFDALNCRSARLCRLCGRFEILLAKRAFKICRALYQIALESKGIFWGRVRLIQFTS